MFSNNIFVKILILISFFLFLICLSAILYEFYKLKKINKDIQFISFIYDNTTKILNFDVNSKRIKKYKSIEALKIFDKSFSDKGYILFSGYSEHYNSSLTHLYSLSKKEIIHSWKAPIINIHDMAPDFTREYNLKKNYRMQHPLLLANGGLIFSSGEGPLVKIDVCGKLLWAINRHFHHSIESLGETIIAPIILKDSINKNFPFLDHGFAILNEKSGNILQEFSILKILEDNNFIGLLYGVGEFEYDRVHLNDAELIYKNDKYVKEGDVMLSSKHLSTVFLYRPSTKKIIWLKTGPWLNQHDVDYLGDGKFTIFGNDTFRYNKVDTYDVFYKNHNKVYLYDMTTDTVNEIYINHMKNISTPTQGLHQILENGDLFIEETDNFKIYRFGKKSKRWEFVNHLNNDYIGSIHWSRYLNSKVDLGWLDKAECND